MVNPKTGRVHTNYAQAVAVTGRLSSTDPNLQNIPVRTAEGRRIREAFVAPPGLEDRLGRLLADRAAHHGAPLGRQGPGRRLRARRGRASPHRRRGVRHAARGGDERAAPLRQGDQLRPHLRHERLRPRAATSASSARPPRATWTSTSRAIPGVAQYMERTRAEAREQRLRGDRLRPAPVAARHHAPRTRRAARAPSARRSTRRCRAPRPTSSSWR